MITFLLFYVFQPNLLNKMETQNLNKFKVYKIVEIKIQDNILCDIKKSDYFLTICI